MTDFQNITFEVDGAVATITLNRPKALNALNSVTLAELGRAIEAVAASDAIRAVLLTGAGKAFVAGADISEMADLSAAAAEGFARQGQRLFHAIEALGVPVIAAINGFALGGGCELAMACDILIAGQKARFGQPEVNLGVIPGFGGTQRLPRLVGRAVAAELLYTGRMVDADEALRIGLVSRVFPQDELLAEARKMADEIAAKGPLAIASLKRTLMAGADLPLERACDREAVAFGACFATEDQSEGMAAFLAKRPADFKGR